MKVAVVSASFFGFFDAPPVLGRYFGVAEDAPPDGAPVVVLSHAMWQIQYGGRRDVLNSKVQIGPAIYTVIGVAPPGFLGLWTSEPPAFFLPMVAYGAAVARSLGFLRDGKETWWTTYHWGWMQMMARAKPGVSDAAANADLTQAFVE